LAVALILGICADRVQAAENPAPAAAAEPAVTGDSASRAPDTRLRLSLRDAVVTGTGEALTVAGLLLSPDLREVPQDGLSREEIRWGLDRRALDRPSRGALTASDLFRAGAMLYPAAMSATTRGPDRLILAEAITLRAQAEAVLVATGITLLLKDLTSRPRPFTYAMQSDLPRGPFFDTSGEGAFASFPSGHAATAWASSMTAVGILATRRPDLSSGVHFLNGVLAGGLATTTSLLRIDAQAHFPTDVAAGAAVGAGAGLAVTLLHAGSPPAGTRRGRAWAYELAGVGAGVALGFLFTPPASPWID
jgi:membrane-associated phospholipid phosphatase